MTEELAGYFLLMASLVVIVTLVWWVMFYTVPALRSWAELEQAHRRWMEEN